MRRTPWKAYAALIVAVPLVVPFMGPGPPGTQGALTFTDFRPDGGETFEADAVVPIAWNATHGNDTWFWGNLSYSLDGGNSYPYFIARTGQAMNGSHPWRVPRFNTTASRVQVCGLAPDGDRGCRQSSGNFTVLATPPYFDLLSPRDGAEGVRPEAPLVFGMEDVDITTVWWTVMPFPPLAWTPSWSGAFRILTLSHATPLPACQFFTVTAGANATDGTPLGPYTWSFSTRCFSGLRNIYPPDNLTNPIIVEFEEPMNSATVTWFIAPNVTLVPTWADYNRRLYLHPSPAFAPCTAYTFGISGLDLEGNPLVPGPVPNPITFLPFCPLYIVWTSPADGEVDVPLIAPIVVAFSRSVNTASMSFQISPPLGGLTFTWSNGDTNLTISHAVPFAPCTTYAVLVSAPDLVPGPVPNPWSFTTACGALLAPTGLSVERVPPDSVRLLWNPVTNATSYRVYASSDRLAPFPWPVLADTADTSIDVSTHLTDGSSHFYLVRAVRDGMEGGNSTMAAKVHVDVPYNPAGANVHWVSLPYRSEYARASDIARELTESNVIAIGKWDPATRTTLLWFHFRGAWRGTDFPLAPGDGVWLGAVRPFIWVIVGTDAPRPLSFTAHDPPSGSWRGLGLPFTGPHAQASDLVLAIEGSLGSGANTRIADVVRWDDATQRLLAFRWTPSGWTGDDFALAPGQAVYLRVVADFLWTPSLITPEVP